MKARFVRNYAVQPRRRTTASGPAPDVRKRRGRKLLMTPDGESHRPRARVDSASSRRSLRRIDGSGCWRAASAPSITELAAAEKIDPSHLCRVLRLTLLAPEIVETIVDGRQPDGMTLPGLMKGSPVEWRGQPRG